MRTPALLFTALALGAATPVAAATPAPAGGAEAEAAPEAAPKSSPRFLPLKPLDVPVPAEGRSGGRLRLLIVLEVDPQERARLEAAMPALREAALLAAIEHARLRVSAFMPVDAARLRADLNAALKQPGVKAVLIQEVSAAPL